IINKTLERTPDIMALMREAVAAVPELVEQLETGRDPRIDIVKTITEAHTLAGGRPAGAPEPGTSYSTPTRATSGAPAQPGADAVAQPAAAHAAPETAVVAEKKTVPTLDDQPPESSASTAMDPALHEIYAKETAGHL